MHKRRCRRLRASALAFTLASALNCSQTLWAQTTINGSALTLRSSGSASGARWTLDENGYVGTYVTLAAPAAVSFSIDASGAPGATPVPPKLGLVVGDNRQSWNVSTSSSTYATTLNLPAGTHFVRVEFPNDVQGDPSRTLSIDRLRITNATVSNSSNTATLNANALAAANTYINTSRKGTVNVQTPFAPGTQIQVKLKRHAFDFGADISGNSLTDLNNILTPNPAPNSTSAKYQAFFNSHFNTLVPANYGKWSNNEAVRNNNTLTTVDRVLDYAQNNNMHARMHNLIWATQQPNWTTPMLANPTSTDPLTGLTNSAALRNEISQRIDYYVGDGDTNPNDGDRAKRYNAIDVYNESWHTGETSATSNYWSIYGKSGIADIYKEVQQAVTATNSNAKVYLNEYNVLQFGADNYGNWYRNHLESIQNAGGANITTGATGPVSGIGIQYYVLNGHSTDAMQKVLQNLSVPNLDLSLTEFGVQSTVTDPNLAVTMLDDSMRMIFGTPNAQAFLIWGWWAGATSSLQSSSVLVDANWNLTPVGQRYEQLMNEWSFNQTLTVGPGGILNFNSFWGDYNLSAQGRDFSLTMAKGTTSYLIPEPQTSLLILFAALPLIRRRLTPQSHPQ